MDDFLLRAECLWDRTAFYSKYLCSGMRNVQLAPDALTESQQSLTTYTPSRTRSGKNMIQARDVHDGVSCWIMQEPSWDLWQFSGAHTEIFVLGGGGGYRGRDILLFPQSTRSTL
jgi:hypothetical protein